MKTLSRHISFAAAVVLLAMITPTVAGDLGNSKDVQQVRKAVPKKFGKILHISVAHDWALCTTYSGESDLSVVLHRSGSDWKVAASDGGAYVGETLKPLGVPSADIPALLKVYQ
jgi:hypothetical protein